MIISPEVITEKFASYDPKRKIAGWIAAGFGSGWLPKAPGTWGSLVSLPPVWWLGDLYGVEAVLWGTLCCTLIGCLVCARVLPHLQSDDPGWIVIDEWAGQWLAFGLIGLFYELSWLNLLLAFVAFRLFDISKPFPIRQIEHVGPAWWAIMADDLLAGIFAGALVLAGFFMVSGL